MSEYDTWMATAVVLHADGQRVLMHKREDFHIWALPGGGLEDGESQEQAAIRETWEETGFQIEIERFVGEYQRPQFHDTRFVYRGRVISGEAIKSGRETLAVDWFLPNELPSNLAPTVREIIKDALLGSSEPLQRTVLFPTWQVWLAKMAIWLRDLRNRIQGRD